MADKTIVVRVNAQTGQYTAEMAAAGRATVGFASDLNAATTQSTDRINRFSRAAGTFGRLVTVGVAGALALSAKAAIDFESSFAGVEKTINATGPQFERLSNNLRALALEIPVNVNALNQIAEIGGQLGVSINGITGFTETIAKLGVTTNLSTEQASLGIARLAEILGVSEDQFENIGSAFVDLGNNFATTEDQILNFALRIAPIGNTVGLTVDQILGLATAFSSVGVPAERGGTAVQKAFIAIAEAAATGGEKLEIFATLAGESVESFQALFERDAAEALSRFLDGLREFEQQGGNIFAILDDIGLGSERTVQALLALSSATGLLDSTLGTAANAFRDNIALQAEADKRFQTTASQIELAKNQIRDFGIELGNNTLPILAEVVEVIGDSATGLAELPTTIKFVVGALAGLTAGFVVATKVAKVFSNLLGIELATKLTSTTVLLRGLAGVAGLAAFGLGIKVLSDYGAAQADAKARVEELTSALQQQREGIEGVTRQTVIDRVIGGDLRQAFEDAGVSVNEFADAIVAGGDKTEDFRRRVEASLGPIEERFRELSLIEQAGGLSPEQAEEFERLRTVGRGLNDVLVELGASSGAFTAALEEQRRIIADENYARSLELLADGFNIYADRRKEIAIEAIQVRKALDSDAQGFENLNEEIDNTIDLIEKLDSELDASFGFVDAIQAVVDAFEELNNSSDPTFDQLLDVQKAVDDLRRAALDAGPNGIQPLIDQLNFLRATGVFTEEQYLQLMEVFLLIQPIAQTFGSGSQIMVGSMEGIAQAADALEVPIGALIQLLLGANAAMIGLANNATLTFEALSLITGGSGKISILSKLPKEDAEAITGGLPVSVILALRKKFEEISSQFVDIGKGVRESIIKGIGSGGGGGGGSIGDAIDDELEDAIERAKDKVNTVIRAIEAQLRQDEALERLTEAEQELTKLRREQANLPDKIARAEERLARARARAARVTLDEKLAIEQAEEALARAEAAFAQGLISETELAIARRDLRQARNASTSEDSDEVQELEDKLKELRDREKQILDDIEEAERDVLRAKIDVIEAQQELNEAQREYNKLGEEGLRLFRRLAREAGLSAKEIRDIINSIEEGLPNISDPDPIGGGGGSGNGGGSGAREYIVQAGDTLGKIAQNLGVTLDRIIGLNATVVNANTGQRRDLNPNLIFPGDILKYHRGGLVPGNQYQESLGLLQGGEVVFNPREPNTGFGNVIIENLNIRGVWDFTNPIQIRNAISIIEQELDANRRSRGLHSTAGVG